jgi:hypothetical protein
VALVKVQTYVAPVPWSCVVAGVVDKPAVTNAFIVIVGVGAA